MYPSYTYEEFYNVQEIIYNKFGYNQKILKLKFYEFIDTGTKFHFHQKKSNIYTCWIFYY